MFLQLTLKYIKSHSPLTLTSGKLVRQVGIIQSNHSVYKNVFLYFYPTLGYRAFSHFSGDKRVIRFCSLFFLSYGVVFDQILEMLFEVLEIERCYMQRRRLCDAPPEEDPPKKLEEQAQPKPSRSIIAAFHAKILISNILHV